MLTFEPCSRGRAETLIPLDTLKQQRNDMHHNLTWSEGKKKKTREGDNPERISALAFHKWFYQLQMTHLLSGHAWINEPGVVEVLTLMRPSQLCWSLFLIKRLLFIFSRHISVKGRNKTMKTTRMKWSVTMQKPRRPQTVLEAGDTSLPLIIWARY